MGDRDETEWLNAAECAARTGVTVRALRIYERHGLITPLRGENGWRHYGHKELVRLNRVALLKATGLTLAQIRAVFDEDEPILAEILHRQIELWKRRKVEAEAGLNVTETILNRLQSRRSLSIDDLCQMVKTLELWNLIDRHIPVEAQRKWNDWWADHESVAADTTAYSEIYNDEVTLPMIALMKAGADPSSPEVQGLIMRGLRLTTQYGIRDAAIHADTASPLTLVKSMDIGQDLMKQAKLHPDEAVKISMVYTPGYPEFSAAAMRQFPLFPRLREICGDFARILATPNDQVSPKLDAAVESFRQLCRDYDLGKPDIYARWSRNFEPYWAGDCKTEPQPIWDFIVQSLEAESESPSA